MAKKLIALLLTLALMLSLGIFAYGNDGGDPEPYRLPIPPIVELCPEDYCDDDEQ